MKPIAETTREQLPTSSAGENKPAVPRRKLTARIEPFDSYWQAPQDVEKGYDAFRQYYRANFSRHLPLDKRAQILVVSCGPGYLVQLLGGGGYDRVLGIDSDAKKIAFAHARGLNCKVEEAFPFLERDVQTYDMIICEQELNHLTIDESLEFLQLCRRRLRTGGELIVYGLNGANPITGAEARAQNIDHFYTFTDYSLRQLLELGGFTDVRVFPLNLYVFYKNPFNYVGLAVTGTLHLAFRILFKLYGKSNRIFTKKIAAICTKPAE